MGGPFGVIRRITTASSGGTQNRPRGLMLRPFASYNMPDTLRGVPMAISRRHFFYGSLLAGAVPSGGFGSTPSLKLMGYKSPNEKLNIASIGSGGKASSDIGTPNVSGCAATENIVALCDVDDKQAART